MTHTPPIPAGNTSPYPLHEPPHVHTSLKVHSDAKSDASSFRLSTGALLVGATVVLGAAATLARFWFASRSKAAAPTQTRRRPVREPKVPAKG